MSFIKNWVKKVAREGWEDARKSSYGEVAVSSIRESNSVDDEPVLNFRIYAASNGKVIEFSKYDRIKDRSHKTIYIVNHEEDLGEKVAKVLSLEMLR